MKMQHVALVDSSVKGVRLSRGITQASLAKSVGVSRQTIISIEQGNYIPSIAVALRIAKTLKVPLESLFWLRYE
jgi:putative transcriptional regulator